MRKLASLRMLRKFAKVDDEKSKENACQVQIPSEQPTSSQSSSGQLQCADTDLIPQSDKDAEKVVIMMDEPVTHQPKQSSTPNPESSECLQCFHFHAGCCNKLPPNRASLIAKVDCQQIASWMYSCVKNVVATVTGTPKPAMSLHGVYEGSCIIVRHVSKEIAAVIKKIQLSLDDQEMLLQCAILSLSCDDKCLFEIAREELVSVCVCVCVWVGAQIIQYVHGCETHPHTKIFTETFIATDETEKYTDVRVILAEFSGGTAAGTEKMKGQGTYSTARRLQEV